MHMSDRHEVEKKPPYTMQLLLEEVATLRNRVKELEDDGHSGKTAPSMDSNESIENYDVTTLKKQLIKAQNDRAELEKEFMNQISMMAQENHENVERLQKQLKMLQCEKNIIKANGSFEQSEEIYELEQEISQLKDVIAAQGDEGVQQLVKKMSATKKEVKYVRDENKLLQQQVEELDGQKATLLEEITHLRIDYEKEAKAIQSLRTEMEHMEKEFRLQEEKFQHDFVEQEETIQHHEESYGEMNDTIVELEGQKAVLLDEITSLRLQLDRENKTKGEMKARIEELTKATMEAGDYKLVGMEQRATAAEENASKLQANLNELQDELRSVTVSYKSDTARLEERLSTRDAQLEELKESIEKKKQEVKEAQEKVNIANEEVKDLKREIEKYEKACAEKEHEIASMVSQRISYEKKATRNIMDHVAEVEDLRAQCESLEDEVDYLKKRLHTELGTPTRSTVATIGTPTRSSIGTPTRSSSSSSLRNANQFRFDQSPPPPPPLRNTPSYLRAQQPPPPPPPLQNTPSYLRAQLNVPRTPVRGMVAKFESIAAGSASRGSVPTDCRSADCPSPPHAIEQDDSDISMSSGEAEAFQQQAASESEQVRELQGKLQKQNELIGELEAEIATLTATRGAQAILVEKDHANKSRDDQEVIESLEKELEETKCKLEAETELVEALREELNILTFEKISYLEQQDSSVEGQRAQRIEMNRLANAVTAAQMETANCEREAKERIRELEDVIETMNAEIDEELAAKQGEIDALRCQLDAQIENVKRMENEREQICMNINSISNAKKAEIDELHEELMRQTNIAAAQAREIDSLVVQVEKQKDATEELEYLQFKVRELEKKSNGGMSRSDLDSLVAENQKLNESLRKMSMERRALQEKLTAVLSEKNSSKSVTVLRERNSALKKEVERLSRRIRNSQKEAPTQRIEI